MKRITLIPGFWERVDIACERSGKTKAKIAKEMCRSRGVMYHKSGDTVNASTLRKFCLVTGASADWLLGLKEDKRLNGQKT